MLLFVIIGNEIKVEEIGHRVETMTIGSVWISSRIGLNWLLCWWRSIDNSSHSVCVCVSPIEYRRVHYRYCTCNNNNNNNTHCSWCKMKSIIRFHLLLLFTCFIQVAWYKLHDTSCMIQVCSCAVPICVYHRQLWANQTQLIRQKTQLRTW